MKLSKLAWAYAAGIIDGEGCIFISKQRQCGRSKTYYSLRIAVSMTDAVVPRWLRRNFGGLVHNKGVRQGKRAGYTWELATKDCAPFLRGVIPLLKIKAKQAHWALRFRETVGPRGTHKRSSRTVARQERLYQKLRALKRTPVLCKIRFR